MNKKGDLTPSRNILRAARKKLSVTPIKFVKRRKSSIPLQLKELISKNGLSQINNEISKKSIKGDYSSKKHCFKDNNNSIPEESESMSNAENKCQILKNDKNKIKDNYYYINYINNVYKNESHLNRENIINTPKVSYNKSFYSNILNLNKKDLNMHKRRNSTLNKDFLNFHKNLCLNKEQNIQKLPNSFLHKMRSGKLNNLINSVTINEKEISKQNNHNKSKIKNKKKSSNDSKHKNSNKKIKNIINTKNEKNIKENGKINDTENVAKTNTEENNNKKSKKTKKNIKNFLCCLINNDESSIQNE